MADDNLIPNLRTMAPDIKRSRRRGRGKAHIRPGSSCGGGRTSSAAGLQPQLADREIPTAPVPDLWAAVRAIPTPAIRDGGLAPGSACRASMPAIRR
jgi:hypothetical protein